MAFEREDKDQLAPNDELGELRPGPDMITLFMHEVLLREKALDAVPEIALIEDPDEREAMLETAMDIVDEGGYGGSPIGHTRSPLTY